MLRHLHKVTRDYVTGFKEEVASNGHH